MAQNTTAPSLLALPTEVHLLIIDYCDHATQYWLSQTCRTFREMDPVKPLLFCDRVENSKILILRDMERWPKNRGKFGCDKCFRLRPQSTFEHGKIHPHPFCLPYESYCCFDCDKYFREPQIYISATDIPTALCMACREWRQSGYYCIRCYSCESCISRQGIGVICGVEPHGTFHWPNGGITEHGFPHMVVDLVTGETTVLRAIPSEDSASGVMDGLIGAEGVE